MRRISRRLFALTALAATVIAAPAVADGGKSIELAKAFPYLENYLKLPPAQRNHFVVAYIITQGGKPVSGLRAWVVQGAQRTPLVIGADGKVARSPTLGQLQSKAMLEVDAPPTTKFGMQLAIEPLTPPSANVDAGYLIIAIAQADAAVKKAAGILGFAAPKLTRVYFKGGAGAEAVWADGHAMKLGSLKGLAFFDPAIERGAKTIRFSRAPSQMEIGPGG